MRTKSKLPFGVLLGCLIIILTGCDSNRSVEKSEAIINDFFKYDRGTEDELEKAIGRVRAENRLIDPELLTSFACKGPNYARKIDLLLLSGVDINYQTERGSTALSHNAVFTRLECVEALLKRGADPFFKSGYRENGPTYTALELVRGDLPDHSIAYSYRPYLGDGETKKKAAEHRLRLRRQIIEVLEEAMAMRK